MTRIAIAFVLGLSWALAACGGSDETQEPARKTDVTVDSAPEAGAPIGEAPRAETQATVESAEPGEKASEE
ncbi:hypothetical protein KJ059_01480 [Myxococcota bacterium]|nr:hypothetical protein [Myxococcota bacterium]MCZ7618331.1 hypothetical protein [Myxococcota bacterium]